MSKCQKCEKGMDMFHMVRCNAPHGTKMFILIK